VTRPTFRIFLAVLGVYALLVLPAYLGPASLQEPSSYFVLVPMLSIHLFHKIGVPGLLEHGGACGWGWCAPTVFGWTVLALFWIGLAWFAASGLARLVARLPR
jgi:hypothetical protein